MQDEIYRREFVKRSVAGSAAIAAGSSALLASATAATAALDLDKRHQLVAVLGDLFVPSAPGDPGYKDLEQYGITDYVLKNLKLSDDLVQAFNDGAKQLFAGKTFWNWMANNGSNTWKPLSTAPRLRTKSNAPNCRRFSAPAERGF